MSQPAARPTEDLFDSAPCGLLTTDPDDRVIQVNSTFLTWTGYSRDDVVGRDFHLLLDSGSRAFYSTRYQAELWARSEVREVALTLVRADGTPMPILVNAAMTATDGAPGVVRVAVFDSTTRQDYERQILTAKRQAETSEASVRVLQEASTHFLAARSENELGEAVHHAARDAFAAFDVAVVAYEPYGVAYRVVIGSHLQQLLDTIRAARPAGSRALRPDEIIFISDLDEAFAYGDEVGRMFRMHRAEAMTAVPIADGEAVLGAFVCLFGRSRTFEQPAIQLQLALARQAGLVLSRLRLQVQLEGLALHDQLTGLANRNLLDQRLSHALAAVERSGGSMALIFVDLDGFKHVNDELGHRAGDTVLQTVASRMNAVVREADIVGRFGGDEFLVICENADAQAATAVAERLTQVIGEPFSFLPPGFGIGASVGIAVHDGGRSGAETSDSLVRRADAAMYESKRSGTGLVTVSRNA